VHSDIRDVDGDRRDDVVAKVVASAAEIAQRRKVWPCLEMALLVCCMD
jgi:hypothetical protein